MIVTNLLNGRIATRIKTMLNRNVFMVAVRAEKTSDGQIVRIALGSYFQGRRVTDLANVLKAVGR